MLFFLEGAESPRPITQSPMMKYPLVPKSFPLDGPVKKKSIEALPTPNVAN